jgi:hypothetical protein
VHSGHERACEARVGALHVRQDMRREQRIERASGCGGRRLSEAAAKLDGQDMPRMPAGECHAVLILNNGLG